MHVTIGGILLALGYGACRARSVWLLSVTGTLAATGILLSLAHGIANHFTGEGITYAVLVHLQYGAAKGELGVMRFPGLVALVLIVFALFLAWWRWAFRRLQVRIAKDGAASDLVGWLVVATIAVLLPLHPAILELRSLHTESSMRNVPLTADLKWKPGPGGLESPRPFVYIYLESFERTFLDESLFPGVAPMLAKLQHEGIALRGVATSPFMNWTMGGMVASQCGMVLTPLLASADRERTGYTPGAHCLGDLLKDAGYQLDYVGGADLGFSGKGRFYRNHGFETIIGFDEIKSRLGSSIAHSEWGAYDDTVIDLARDHFSRLVQSGHPFGLFMLTTTTHPHRGYPSPSCRNQGTFKNPMLDAAHCSDMQVYEFVRWLQREGPDDLLIVLASDHLQVAGEASDLLKQSSHRDNLFVALGSDIQPRIIDRPSTMVDVAPTLATLIGFDMEALGLGRNLLAPEPTLAEQYGIAQFNSMLPQWRLGLSREDTGPSATMSACPRTTLNAAARQPAPHSEPPDQQPALRQDQSI